MNNRDLAKKYFSRYSNSSLNLRYKYNEIYEKKKVIDKTVLYESRDGNSFVDSPYRIFQNLIVNRKYFDYHHYIVVSNDNKDEIKKIVNLIPNRQTENIRFVERNSLEYLECLCTCKYLVNNSTFQSFFIKKEDQVYINTWHGTPLKLMGFDIPGNPAHSQNVLRNYLKVDFLLSPNEHTTNIFLNSYKLDGIFEGTIIEDGYPRIDNTIRPMVNVREKASRFGLKINDKPVVLYSPTWSGDAVSSPTNNVKQLINEFAYIREQLADKYQVFVKVHPFLFKYVRDEPELKGYLVSDYFDVNEFLSMVDILITDYSSIFFDFLVTKKPIFFYCPDYEQYIDDRGVYIQLSELPGMVSTTVMELCKNIRESNGNKYRDIYNTFLKSYCTYDDGKVTDRLISKIIDGNMPEIKVVQSKNTKEKLLFYPGGMRNNGITTSFINLMSNINYDKYDVSIIMRPPRNWEFEILNNLSKLPNTVRFLFNGGNSALLFSEDLADENYRANPNKKSYLKKLPIKGYHREFKRLMGNSHFDVSVDFSGYSFFWGKYIAFSNACKKLVFLHNDLLSDSNRIVNGEKIHFNNLHGLFGIYDYFDKLISVSKATMEINEKNLSKYVDNPDKFDYSINTINPNKIIALSQGKELVEESKKAKFNVRKLKDLGYPKVNQCMVYSKIYDIEKMVFEYFTFNQDALIEIVASSNINGKEYFKILKDHILIGWVDAENIRKVHDQIYEEIEHKFLYRLIYPGNHVIWRYPYNSREENYRVTRANTLRGIYFWSSKLVKTNRATYVNVIIDGREFGWIDIRSSKNMFDNQKNILKKYYINKSKTVNKSLYYKVEENIVSFAPLKSFVTLNLRSQDSIWKKPYGMYKNKKINVSQNIIDTRIFKVKQKATTNKSTYFNIFLDNMEIGWVDQNAVIVFDDENIEELGRNYVDMVVTLSLGLKDAIWEKPYGFKNNKKLKIPGEEELFEVDTIIETRYGHYCHIKSNDGITGYVDKRCCNVLENNTLSNIDGEMIGSIDTNYKNFINMGRLSPEKNQENLIRAFSKFIQTGEKARLYILGSGPLEETLKQVIIDLGLQENVFLLGQKENPFALLSKCDYFILPSIYEGQPMVLLEALTLKMSIIASNIPANKDVLKNGQLGTLIVGTTEDAIFETLKDKKYESFVGESFDAVDYNSNAISNFERFTSL
ncbi:CDP-glycerol glycerophosphotransferase family protein [Enterococcus faecium]|uniref:CDP-glycerol:poly(Glycerophosphate) glycerophosphotransferase n=1 Tax=Enterococcus faecium SD2A-2 TaxID=1244154 RepID=A0AB73ADJ1_ENTFC|nr:CDP-glycerol glycerophosphotransferase family protein [Enterococcus faecium]EPI16764.1 CDP-glycerol:poly(glycerophosphate) glycerophosphotransferase [Enterococcus faecium SD2A-2]UTU60097.1 CDP-glycerol glycerophosphotransferase family protein [Enterococcus faecium]